MNRSAPYHPYAATATKKKSTTTKQAAAVRRVSGGPVRSTTKRPVSGAPARVKPAPTQSRNYASQAPVQSRGSGRPKRLAAKRAELFMAEEQRRNPDLWKNEAPEDHDDANYDFRKDQSDEEDPLDYFEDAPSDDDDSEEDESYESDDY